MKTVAFFGHVPHTGGTTMRKILHRQYGPDRTGILSIINFAGDLAQLEASLDGRQEPPDLIITHAGYGVHEKASGLYKATSLHFFA